jgi:hypothetical protein
MPTGEQGVVTIMQECNGTPDDSTVCAKGVTSLEVETDNQKEDVSVQVESKSSEEAFICLRPELLMVPRTVMRNLKGQSC